MGEGVELGRGDRVEEPHQLAVGAARGGAAIARRAGVYMVKDLHQLAFHRVLSYEARRRSMVGSPGSILLFLATMLLYYSVTWEGQYLVGEVYDGA